MTGPARPGAGTVPLPADVTGLDAAFMTVALRRGGADVTVDSVTAEPFPTGTGFLGDHARLHLTYDGAPGPGTVVAKLPPADEGGRTVGRLLGVWWREHRFYTDLAPGSGLPVPACHFSGADRERERYVLLLDDLTDRSVTVDQVAGASDAQADAAVDALAVLHARWWDRAGDELAWMPSIGAPAVGSALQEAVVASLGRFGGRFGDLVSPASVDRLRAFAPRLRTWLAARAAGPLVVAHADYQLGNLRFGTDGVWILDWQTAMRTAPATDLAIFCGTSLTTERRRAREDALLARYRERLAEEGVSVDAGHLRRDYSESFLWWAAMFAHNLSAIEAPDDRSRALFDSMVARTHAAIDDLGPEASP